MKKSLIFVMCLSFLFLVACGKKGNIVNLDACFEISNRGVFVSGTVANGEICEGDNVIIKTKGQEISTKVVSLVKDRNLVDKVIKGDVTDIYIDYPERFEVSEGDTMVVQEN